MSKKDPVAEVWQCPKCDFTYNSPLEVEAVWHLCPARDKKNTYLKKLDIEKSKG